MGNYSAEEKAGRDAWRSMLVPAVGSIAFFASLVVNVIRNYKNMAGLLMHLKEAITF